jgi:hypothetical protein
MDSNEMIQSGDMRDNGNRLSIKDELTQDKSLYNTTSTGLMEEAKTSEEKSVGKVNYKK